MCGIVAVIGDSQLKTPVLRASLDVLAPRGPDSEGTWFAADSSVALGHRRLAIVDISASGHQPMLNEDASLILVCNGEIYNYPSLRKRLEALGHTFASRCDSEAILHAYEQWGHDCINELEGMFAFVIWDTRTKQLFAARDSIGIKPLYYAYTQGQLALASTASALLPLLQQKPKLHAESLAYTLTLGYVPAPLSIWENIQQLEPGQYLLSKKGETPKLTTYWEPPCCCEPQTNHAAWPELFHSVLQEHLLADVPLGILLSSGLDSSSVALGLHEIGASLSACTMSFPQKNDDESILAAEISKQFAFTHHTMKMEMPDILPLLSETMRHYDEPQGFGALLTMFGISQEISKRHKAVFSGDGGDEVFGGYSWYEHLRRMEMRRGRIRTQARHLFQTASRIFGKKWNAQDEAFAFVKNQASLQFPRFSADEACLLLSPMGLSFDERRMLEPLQKHYVADMPPLRAAQRIDLLTFCANSILPKVDRASMACGLEVRVPLLDRRIVTWGLSRPIAPFERVKSKLLLREYLKGKVPAQVLTRPKQGFSLRAMNDFDWNAALDIIDSSRIVSDGYLNPQWRDLIDSDQPDRTGRIWSLLMLGAWSDIWLT